MVFTWPSLQTTPVYCLRPDWPPHLRRSCDVHHGEQTPSLLLLFLLLMELSLVAAASSQPLLNLLWASKRVFVVRSNWT
jgi:hypothetical protein